MKDTAFSREEQTSSEQPTVNEQQQVNGVNVDELFATIDAIKVEPEIAKFNFRASNKWVNGGQNRTIVKDFYGACQEIKRDRSFVFEKDEPPILLGADRGANPVEYVFAALAGCLTTSLVYHAAARGIEIQSIESKLEGDLDLRGFLGMNPDVRNGYEQIRVTFSVKADAPEETVRELVELAQKRSPVFDIVTNGVPVSVALAEA
jgi:uncharacterized OsmC-like protein